MSDSSDRQTRKADSYRVVGVDPGLANLGMGAVEEVGKQPRLLDSLLLKTSPRTLQPDRLRSIRDSVTAFLVANRPHAVVIEGQFFHHQKSAAFKVGQSFGVIMLCASDMGLPVYEYGPLQVKQTLVGTGRADKAQVAYMVRALLKLPKTPESDHVSDAIALALTHLQSRRIGQLTKAPL
ncbi:MAG TPA: crossover junction endodeoxyribonuclease RuvC [Trueperaceae bacterium]|nr:crossover junction endodeoxyribonuclease RuvC [Trueperaceae bacterium]